MRKNDSALSDSARGQTGGRMYPFIFLFAASLVLAQSTFAELAARGEMDQVCSNWLSYVVHESGSWAGSIDPQIAGVREIADGDLVMALCYTISPDGFVVVPVIKELPPIKVFSDEGALTLDEPGGIGLLLRDVLADRTSKYVERYGDLDAAQTDGESVLFDRINGRAWDRYAMSDEDFAAFLRSADRDRFEQVGPLLSTAWHQTSPYNMYCPMGDGGQCVVWCVATALAQILWYHQWPPAGFGHTSYIWNGDQSCGGSTSGRFLWANFSDRYGFSGTTHEVAEIGFEVGMSYNVDYGVCYSIGYAEPIFDLLPENFGYLDQVEVLARSSYTGAEWFAIVQEEINSDRPIDYLIYNHMIVADGWATEGLQYYYHMNYGWGGAQNAWYALDNLYCTWPGCDPMAEFMFTKICPDRGIMFYADTIAGDVPLQIDFTASSDRDVDDWIWSFGDGDSAFAQAPTHTYDTPGVYDVSLSISYNDSSRSKIRPQYICAIADTMYIEDAEIYPGDTLEVSIYASNLIPLSEIQIPLEYDGDLELQYHSPVIRNCRTEMFQAVYLTDLDDENRRVTIGIKAWVDGYSEFPYLEPGYGRILIMCFVVSPDAVPGQETTIRVGSYGSYDPVFHGSIYGFEHDYRPAALSGTVRLKATCGDADGSRAVDIDDAVFLVNYIFAGGPPPDPEESGDADCSGGLDIDDVVNLIAFIFSGGDAPCDTDGDGEPDC